ncbi:MAG: hypothetical protein ACKVQA_06865 [Burkholderiales bacterium]
MNTTVRDIVDAARSWSKTPCPFCLHPWPRGVSMVTPAIHRPHCPDTFTDAMLTTTPLEHICNCGTVMVCPDIGCDKNKPPTADTLRAEAEACRHELKLIAAVVSETLESGNESTRAMRSAAEIIARLLEEQEGR